MARRIWSEEDLADIKRRWGFGFTYAEIAEHYGVSKGALKLTVRRYGLVDPAEGTAAGHAQLKGRPKTEETKRKLAEAQRATWTPERRLETSDRLRAHRATEMGKTEVQHALQVRARNARGFDLPDELRDEYRFLRRTKNIPAREAGAILGLTPQPQPTGGR